MDLKEQLEEPVSPVSPVAKRGIEVVALQPQSIIDHVLKVDANTLKSLVTDELGGSHRVSLPEIQKMLLSVGEYFSKAGGSASNVMRGLAGFGVGSKLVGARGQDEPGALFISSMRRAGVNVDAVLPKEGATGRCVILSCEGQRTMRTCLDGAARLLPSELEAFHFDGCAYLFVSGYVFYSEGLVDRAVELATAAGSKIALDLASFEVVRAFRPQLAALLDSGVVAVCFCNEDEAAEWAATAGSDGGGEAAAAFTPEHGLEALAAQCDVTVVTLGEKGCLVKGRGASEVIAVPACSGVTAIDTTGAGDLFASGFLFSLLRGFGLRRAAEIGCLAGGAVVQTLGSEMGPENWEWVHQRFSGNAELAAETVRSSAAAVQQELLACYALIEREGRGVVYYGSARLRQGSKGGHWERARALGADVARLLGCTTWTGGGPGMMEAASLGAMDAGGRVAGIRIGREAGTTVRTASYLPADSNYVCRFMSSRKVALTDSGVRMKESDRTAFVFLAGGLGTMDELFELLCLVQLKKLGTRFPCPIVVCNFAGDSGVGVYDGLLDFLASCVEQQTVGTVEMRDVLVASDEQGVIDALATFYDLPLPDGGQRGHLTRASDWIEARSKKAEDGGIAI